MAQKDSIASQFVALRTAPKRMAIGALVMALSGAIGARIYQQDNAAISVLQVTRDVAAGQRLSATDVRKQPLPAGLADGSWLQLEDLAGSKVTSHPLRAGALLYLSDLTAAEARDPVVAFRVALGRLPTDLHAGESVALWFADSEAARLLSQKAMLVSVAPDENDGSWLLSAEVPIAEVSNVLAAIAADALAVVAN